MQRIKGWLVGNGCLKTKLFMDMFESYKNAADTLNIDLELVWNDEIYSMIDEGKAKLACLKDGKPDFVLFLDKDIYLAVQLEHLGFRIFNKAQAISLCDDKAKTFQALMGKDIPMPKTILAPFFYSGLGKVDKNYIDNLEKLLNYPMVIKENYGSLGKQVYLVNNREELLKKQEELLEKPHLYQEFIKTSSGKDLRLYVVGKRVVASMLRESQNDFRANLAEGGKAKSYVPEPEYIKLAVQVCDLLQLDFAGVDLLFGPEQRPILCEVNSNAYIKGIQECTGVNIALEILKYIGNQLLD